jgi:hypothetical protein
MDAGSTNTEVLHARAIKQCNLAKSIHASNRGTLCSGSARRAARPATTHHFGVEPFSSASARTAPSRSAADGRRAWCRHHRHQQLLNGSGPVGKGVRGASPAAAAAAAPGRQCPRDYMFSRRGAGVDTPRAPVQVFIVRIRLGQFYWTVYRRFSQFRNLSDQVRLGGLPACFSFVVLTACRACAAAQARPRRAPMPAKEDNRHS